MSDEVVPVPPRLRRWAVPKSLRRGLMVFGLLLALEYLVLPELAGARKAAHLLSNLNPIYLAAGVGLEVAALVAYAQLTRSVLGSPLSLWTVLRIDLCTLAVSHVVPGGSAAGTSLGYRLLTEEGVPGADAGFGLATQGMGSAAVLNVLLWLGLVISIPTAGFNPLYGTAAILGALLLGAFTVLVLLLTRGEEWAADVLRAAARKTPFLDGEAVNRLVRRLATRLRQLFGDRPLLLRAVAWAAANWLLDAASLWVCLAAFGKLVSPDALLVSYGLANVLAAIPVTPGGLGVVEGVLTSALVGFGSARGVAILGVISWRLVNFWLPIPVGGLSYISLRIDEDEGVTVAPLEPVPAAPPVADREQPDVIAGGPAAEAPELNRPRAAALERLARRATDGAEDRRGWAARHGVRIRRSP